MGEFLLCFALVSLVGLEFYDRRRREVKSSDVKADPDVIHDIVFDFTAEEVSWVRSAATSNPQLSNAVMSISQQIIAESNERMVNSVPKGDSMGYRLHIERLAGRAEAAKMMQDAWRMIISGNAEELIRRNERMKEAQKKRV